MNCLPVMLVVEDNPSARDLLACLVRFSKFRVAHAAYHGEPLAAVQNRSDIALVLTNIVTPGMRGCDLAGKTLAIRPATRIMFMSGFSANPLRRAVNAPRLAPSFTGEEGPGVVDEALKDAS